MKILKASITGAALVGSLTLLGASPAGAQEADIGVHAGLSTGDNDGLLSGNQVLVDVDIPVNVAGIAIGLLG